MSIQADHGSNRGLTRRDVLRAAAAGLVIGTDYWWFLSGIFVCRNRHKPS